MSVHAAMSFVHVPDDAVPSMHGKCEDGDEAQQRDHVEKKAGSSDAELTVRMSVVDGEGSRQSMVRAFCFSS